tara:strand:+ start:593 stop:919 length:327 start_codon:yes stop_codon:yes gene_type:complete
VLTVPTGHIQFTDATLVLTDQQPDQTQTLFGFPVTGFVAAIVGFGCPVIGNVVQQPPVITVHVVGNDNNCAFGKGILFPKAFLLLKYEAHRKTQEIYGASRAAGKRIV